MMKDPRDPEVYPTVARRILVSCLNWNVYDNDGLS